MIAKKFLISSSQEIIARLNKVFLIIGTIVTLSLTIAIFMSIESHEVEVPVEVAIGRIDYEVPNDYQVNSRNSQMILKHLELKDAMDKADFQLADYKGKCGIKCRLGGSAVSAGPTIKFEISNEKANRMIDDSDFNFQRAPWPDDKVKLYTTYIKIGDKTYGILLSTR